MDMPQTVSGATEAGNEPARPRDSALLYGPPSLPFVQRYTRKQAQLSFRFDVLAMVVILISAYRHSKIGPLPPEGARYLAVYGSACAASIATYLLARPAYMWWMELTAIFLRLCLLGMTMGDGGWHLSRRMLNQPPASQLAASTGACSSILGQGWWLLRELGRHTTHANLLLFASHTIPMAHVALCRPMRLWLSVLAQAVLAAHSLTQAASMCSTAQLSAPEAQVLTHRLFVPLSSAALFLPLPLPLPAAQAPLVGPMECATLLRFFQLTIGVLAPLAWQAGTQSALFAAHQRQRAATGVAPELGFSTLLYGAIEDLKDALVLPYLYLLGAMAVGLCWQAAVGLSWPLAVVPTQTAGLHVAS